MKLGELAARLGCTLEGDPEIEIHGAQGLEEAKAGDVSFLSNPRYSRELATTYASAVLVENKVVLKREFGFPELAAIRQSGPCALNRVFKDPISKIPDSRFAALAAARTGPGAATETASNPILCTTGLGRSSGKLLIL